MDDYLIFAPDDVDLSRSPLRTSLEAETFVLGAFNPGLARLPNGNLLMMVRVAEALKEPVVDGHVRAIRWTTDGYVLDPHALTRVNMSDPRQFDVGGGAYRMLALTSLSWILPVELDRDGRRVVAVHYDKAIAPEASYQAYGVEDARVTLIDGTYYMTTCAVSPERHCTALHTSTDGLTYQLEGVVLDHQNKDMILFEGKIDGAFVALTRPLGELYFAYPEGSGFAGGPSINLARSPDALHWKPLDQPFLRARVGSTSAMKVGGGSQPILTPEGWLMLYHGVETRARVGVYRTFWALLDAHEPWRILRLEDATPLLEAAPALTAGIAHQLYLPTEVVFTTGIADGGDHYVVASGEADLACRIHPHPQAPLRMSEPTWWQRGVIYQVYPRSFQDTDGDGIGDLAGIERRLDHFVDLGVDALWVSPIYPSPMVDFGYDVSDYTGIHPMFGTLADFDRLLAAAHARGLKLLLDFVPNHSSDRHPWFLASRSSRTDPKRDWYIWRDPAPGGGPPNNWISDFGGSAWQWDEATGQYYYHAMLVEQPDLNWRDPGLKAAMLDAMRFWFDRGVDGLRVDILWHLVKAGDFPDNPPNPEWTPGMADMARVLQLYSTDQPEVHGLAAAMRKVADGYGAGDQGRVLIGEIYLPVDRLMDYYGTSAAPEMHLPFNFQLIDAPWEARALHRLVVDYDAALPPGGWPNWVLGNHDRPRVATKRGEAQARVAAMLLLTLRGTPTIYYGDEIGMADVAVPPDRVRDPRELREPGLGFGRDPVRTPMAWDGSPNAGFTEGEPWLPLHADWGTRNVAAEDRDPGSMLSLHRALLRLRRAHPALAVGAMRMIEADGDALVYEREHEGERIVVALNLGSEKQAVTLPEGRYRCLLSTVLLRRQEPSSDVTDAGLLPAQEHNILRPNEGLVLLAERG